MLEHGQLPPDANMLQNLSVFGVTEHAVLKQFTLSLSTLVKVVVIVNQ